MFTRIAVGSCFAILGMAASAGAADLDEIIYAKELPVTQPVEIGSGWYLRGDLGYSFNTDGGANSYRIFNAGPPVSYGTGLFNSSDLTSDWSGSAGVGYHFSDYLRADATFEYSTGEFGGTTSSAVPCPGGPAGTGCASTDVQSFEQYGIMANAYVDLGTYVGFTPYIGGGAGVSRVTWNTLNSTNRCVPAPGFPCGAAPAGTSSPGQEDWRFTYALMAGLSYDLTKNMKLDLGYRYSKIKGGPQFNFDAATAAAGATGAQAEDGGIEKHEIRAGLRYSLW
ncbi:outer membrane beta-barrel protein [Hoeflea sp.]|uniref:outer membrane protein n=1 Tax=Hoeflea sp. TaxID=1940281 RepID=UPI003B52104B